MTGDQRLIVKLEQVSAAIDADRLLAAYHQLDEIVAELDLASRDAHRPPAHDRRERERGIQAAHRVAGSAHGPAHSGSALASTAPAGVVHAGPTLAGAARPRSRIAAAG